MKGIAKTGAVQLILTNITNKGKMDETVDSWPFDLDTADVNIYSCDAIEILDYTHTLIHEYGHLLTLNLLPIPGVTRV